jgi:hypothetical protein
MKQFPSTIGILILTFIAGVGASRLVREVTFPRSEKEVVVTNQLPLSSISTQFIRMGALLEPDYHVYRYKTPGSSDDEEINLFGNFRSAQLTRELFESNASTNAAKLIERGYKFDEQGNKIGERGVAVFKSLKAVRIFWTQGDIFRAVQTPSLELARQFEASEVVRSITMSNERLRPTPR